MSNNAYLVGANAQRVSTYPVNPPFFKATSSNPGRQPSYIDRKAYIKTSPTFAGTATLEIESSNRTSGGINGATFLLQRPFNAYAMSLKSLVLPCTWPNLLVAQTITVTYVYSGSPQGYPTTVTIPQGSYNYSMNVGQITYTYVNAQPSYVNQNDLTWYLLRQFQGALSSIQINPTTGAWTWNWNSSTLTSVTSTSSSVSGLFQVPTSGQSGTTWTGTGVVDLTGPKIILIQCTELHTDSFFTTSSTTQSFICSAPVNVTLDKF